MAVSAPSELRGRTEPRLFTRPLRELTPRTSLGFEACGFITDVLGEHLLPWQRWFLVHSLELAEGSTTADKFPRLRFSTVLLLVARQQGKSRAMSRRGLWRMFCWDGPEVEPPLVLGAAHKLGTAEEVLDLAFQAVNRDEELRRHIGRRSKVNGDKHFSLVNGSRYKAEAASDDGGRGLSPIDVLFDELRQQRDWSSWSALTNATGARFSSQVIGVSNAGEPKSEVLRSLRTKAIEQLDSGGDLFLAEWSGPDGCDIDDWDALAQANPALNVPIPGGVPLLTTRDIEAKLSLVGRGGEGVPESKFRAETLCQFTVLDVDGPFPPGAWAGCSDAPNGPRARGSRIDPDSPIAIGVDTSHDRSMSYIALAGWRADGHAHIEVVQRRAGMVWLPDMVRHLWIDGPMAGRFTSVGMQARGCPASEFVDAWPGEDVVVDACGGPELGRSFGGLYDRVVSGTVRHRNQEVLTAAADTAATKRLGDVLVLNRSGSPIDSAPLGACAFALWALERMGRREPVRVSAYESSDLVVI